MEDEITFIFPRRPDGGRRDDLAAWTIHRVAALAPRATIVTADAGGELFNRAASINKGFRQSRPSGMVIVSDLDTVWNPSVLHDAVRIYEAGRWGFPYNSYNFLTNEATDVLLRQPADVEIVDPDIYMETVAQSETEHPLSGFLVFSACDFKHTGGFHQEFSGWGYEDDAFVFNACARLGGPMRTTNKVFHMEHPRSNQEHIDSPVAAANRKVYDEYVRNWPRSFVDYL